MHRGLLVLALWLAGCHLVFPFDSRSTDAAATDGSELDGGPRPDGDGPHLDGPFPSEAGPPVDGGPSPTGKICSEDNWCWEHPLPQGNQLHGVWIDGPSEIYAVGDRGTILRWDGSAWSKMGSGTVKNLHAIWGTTGASKVLYAVGDGGTILQNNGSGWTPQVSPSTADLRGVLGSGGGVYAVGSGGTVLEREGGQWSILGTVPGGPTLYGVWGSGTKLYVVGNGGIWSTMGGAFTVEHFDAAQAFRDIWGTSSTHAVAVGAGTDASNGVVATLDATGNWTVTTPTISSLTGVWCSGPTACWVASETGVFVYSVSGWSKVTLPPSPAALDCVRGDAAGNLAVAGPAGVVHRYDAAGGKWTALWEGTNLGLNGVWTTGGGAKAFAVGNAGLILTRGPLRWNKWSYSGTTTLNAVWGSSASSVYAVGDAGKVYRYNGGFISAVLTTFTENLHGVAGDATHLVVVGDSGVVASTELAGVSGWHEVSILFSGARRDVWVGPQSKAVVVGDNGTIYTYTIGVGLVAMASNTLAQLNGVWGSSPLDIHAVGAGGTILRYDGSAWKPQSAGTAADLFGVAGRSTADVYAVGNGGAVLHFDGTAWMPEASGTNLPLHDVWADPAGGTWAVGALGAILQRQ
jgi:hypothetical protein